jgi:hypothetical protein
LSHPVNLNLTLPEWERQLELRRIRWRLSPALLFAIVPCAGSTATPALAHLDHVHADDARQDDAPPPGATHYTRTLGPYLIDRANFTVELSVICHKGTRHPGECNEDDEETVKSMKIADEAGKTCFHASFPVAFAHQVERHIVEVTRLEGAEHQALELQFEQLPSHANTGVSIQVFGVRNGTLQAFNDDPLEFYGGLGALPAGSSKDSRRLLAGDMLSIYVLTNYFYIVQPVRVNWKDFRLEPQANGEFEVAQQAPYSRKPEIQTDGYIHLYASPDQNAASAGAAVTPQSSVQVLSAIFRASPSEAHSSASNTWIKISVDGKVGWIVGLDDYTAIGLSAAH